LDLQWKVRFWLVNIGCIYCYYFLSLIFFLILFRMPPPSRAHILLLYCCATYRAGPCYIVCRGPTRQSALSHKGTNNETLNIIYIIKRYIYTNVSHPERSRTYAYNNTWVFYIHARALQPQGGTCSCFLFGGPHRNILYYYYYKDSLQAHIIWSPHGFRFCSIALYFRFNNATMYTDPLLQVGNISYYYYYIRIVYRYI